MSRPTIAALVTVLVLGCQSQSAPGPASAAPGSETTVAEPAYDGPPKTVLVELFSSQGCNSCPAAEALVGRLAQLGYGRERVVPLTFHVTYWDDLGWADPYASPLFDQRQIAYAQIVPQARADDETTIRGPYTPQMVVDGREHFSGSLEEVASEEIEAAAQRPTAIRLSPSVTWTEGSVGVELESAVAVDVGLDTDRTKVGLFAALVETRVETEVPRGENAGKTLIEHAVVRAFAGPKLFRSGRALNHTQFELALPAGLERDAAEVVVFAQNLGTLEVLAVALAEP